MNALKLTPFVLLFVSLSVAQAGNYCPSPNVPKAYINPNTRSVNLKGPVHPAALNTLSCVVNGLRKAGLPIKTLWGYGCRPLPNSNHPRGLAVDVDQYARNKTSPTVPWNQGIEIARACNATSGAVWHNPDNGHFEVRSMSRAQQAKASPTTRRVPQVRTRQTRAQQLQQPTWFWLW